MMVGNNDSEEVKCSECGAVESFPAGYLTEHGKANYLCRVCREKVLENRVVEKRKGGRILLTED